MVVFPEPVGPVERTIPWGLEMMATKSLEGVGCHPQFLQVDAPGLLVQEPQNHALPVKGREGGDPDVHLPVLHPQADPAVLGNPSLRDIQLGHDLEPAHHGSRQSLGWGHGVLKDAVDPVPDPQATRVALQVDIGGPGIQRLQQKEVHQLHHRRLVGQHDQIVQGRIQLAPGAKFLGHPRHYPLCRQGIGGIDPPDGRSNILLRKGDQLHRDPGQNPEVVQCPLVHHFCPGGREQLPPVQSHGHEGVVLQVLGSEARREALRVQQSGGRIELGHSSQFLPIRVVSGRMGSSGRIVSTRIVST